jgi:hypothetical protein
MPLFTLHAVLMAAGFLLFLSALLVAATQRSRQWWLRTHRATGLAGTAAMLAGASAAVAAVSESGSPHLATPHTWLGALTLALAVITPVLGHFQLRLRRRSGILRPLHRLGGRGLSVAALLTLMMGLRLAGIL